MEEPLFSPDGKHMWTGEEWIPAPPNDDDAVRVEPFTYGGNFQGSSVNAVPVSQANTILYPPKNEIILDYIVIGIICLVVVAISYSSYQNSICGTFLSPLAGEDCSIWNAFNLIVGGGGILAISIGFRGRPPRTTIQYIPKQQTVNHIHQKPKSGFPIALLSVFGVTLLLVFSGILYSWIVSFSNDEYLDPDGDFDGDGIINSEDLDDDNDGFLDNDDWYDKGNGGIEISFTKFRVWGGGNYDSGGGLPDVYAYVGIGNANCGNMQYFSYLDDINVDASSLNNWKSFTYDFDEDATSVCIEVTIYDEDSWAPDEILDFIPGSANYYRHSFDLSSSEGDASIDHDNRGENSLSIELGYTFKRVSISG